MMTKDEILDLLERAYKWGCFAEVVKLIRQDTEKILIEVILEKAEEKYNKNPFNWDDFFGGD